MQDKYYFVELDKFLYFLIEGGGIIKTFYSAQIMNTTGKSQIISVLKEWASPTLICIVGMLLFRDVTEMRTDVKTLLSQSYVDKTRIDNLEKRMDQLERKIYIQATNLPGSIPIGNSEKLPIPEMFASVVAIKSEKYKKNVLTKNQPKTTL